MYTIFKGVDYVNNIINASIRIDKDLKKQADYTLKSMGLPFSTAVVMFLKQVVNTGELPFVPKADLTTNELLENSLKYKTELSQSIEEIKNGDIVSGDKYGW
jgi:addiction module RelB/DinJ family antitoxin